MPGTSCPLRTSSTAAVSSESEGYTDETDHRAERAELRLSTAMYDSSEPQASR